VITMARAEAARLGGFARAAIDGRTRTGMAVLDAAFPPPLRTFVDPGPIPPANPE
jgi:hypothetical protein